MADLHTTSPMRTILVAGIPLYIDVVDNIKSKLISRQAAERLRA